MLFSLSRNDTSSNSPESLLIRAPFFNESLQIFHVIHSPSRNSVSHVFLVLSLDVGNNVFVWSPDIGNNVFVVSEGELIVDVFLRVAK